MPGRKVVPIGLNKKHFTKSEHGVRESAEARLAGASDKIKAPHWLDKEAALEFRRLAKELKALKIVANTDVGGLAIACDAYSKYIMATTAITASTIDAEIQKVKGDKDDEAGQTTVKRHPLGAVEKYATIYRQYCAEYGLTPAARIKMSAALPEERQEVHGGIADFMAQKRGGGVV